MESTKYWSSSIGLETQITILFFCHSLRIGAVKDIHIARVHENAKSIALHGGLGSEI